MALNKVFIMGRLTKDVELRKTQSGKSVATLTLAVDRNGKEKETDFIDTVAWGNSAEFASKYLSKGRMVVAEGRLQSRKWTDKNGNNRVSWEVQADNLYAADSKPKEQKEPHFTEVDEDGEESLPF